MRKVIKITVFVDSSLGNEEERKSCYGFIIYLNRSPIHFKSKKLPMVNLSSTEAEYVALATAVQEVKWILNHMKEINTQIDAIDVFLW